MECACGANARKEVGWVMHSPPARLRTVIERECKDHLPEFELAINTGLGKGSMYGLTWAMVDWSGRMLNIPTGKNGKRCTFR